MDNTLFFHGKTLDGKRFTVAGKFESKSKLLSKKSFLVLGLAICSGKDAFVKKVGRIKAEGRLNSVQTVGKINIPVKISNKDTIKTFIEIVKDYTNLTGKTLQREFRLANNK